MTLTVSEFVRLTSQDLRGQGEARMRKSGGQGKVRKADARSRKSGEARHIDEAQSGNPNPFHAARGMEDAAVI